MPVTIKATLSSEQGTVELTLPQDQHRLDKSLNGVRSQLGYPDEMQITHANSSFAVLNPALTYARDIEELNFLAQLLEGLDEDDLQTYRSILESVHDILPVPQLINLAYDLDEFAPTASIQDAEDLGAEYAEGCDSETDELILRNTYDDGEIDFEGIGMDLHIAEHGLFTSAGYVRGINKLADGPYNGGCFPRYCYNGDAALGVSLHRKNNEEGADLFLPASGSVLQRALKRIGVQRLDLCEIKPIWGFPSPLSEKALPVEEIHILNAAARWISALPPEQAGKVLTVTYAAKPESAQEYRDIIFDKIRQVQCPEALNIVTYYFPLAVSLRDKDNEELYEGEYYADDLSPSDALEYADDILARLQIENNRFDTARLLAEYLRSDMLSGKVYSMRPTVEKHGGKLWGAMEMRVAGELTSAEIAGLKDYITGQNSDGFGEGFEQREIQTSNGELYVHFWSDRKGYAIYTPEEFAALHHGYPGPSPRKLPDCPMVGADGNVFNLIGLAARTLRDNGMSDAADEMRNRVAASGSYHEALAIMTEYVNPVSAREAPQPGSVDLGMQ